MRDSYWLFEDGLWYYGDSFVTRYKVDFENKSVIEQYNVMGEWNDGDLVSPISFPWNLDELKLTVESFYQGKLIEEQEWMNEVMDEYYKEELKRFEERDSWKKILKGLINTKKLWKELEEDMESWWIEGIVEIELTGTSHKNYPNSICAKIKGENGRTYTDYRNEGVFNWQTVGYLGDDYSGFTLHPLKNGKYLKISYSC